MDKWNDFYKKLVDSTDNFESKLSKAKLHFEQNLLDFGDSTPIEATKMILKFLFESPEENADLQLSTLNQVLERLESHFDNFSEEEMLKIRTRLQILSKKTIFECSFPLQKFRYRIGNSHIDPATAIDFSRRFNETNNSQYRLTTESLMDLKHFHDLLKSKCCCAFNMEFLKFYLKRIISATKDSCVKYAILYTKSFDILENVRAEIYKILYCLYGLEFGKRPVTHERPLNAPQFSPLKSKDCEEILAFFTFMNLETSFETRIFDLDIVELKKKLQPTIKRLDRNPELNTLERQYLSLAKTLAQPTTVQNEDNDRDIALLALLNDSPTPSSINESNEGENTHQMSPNAPLTVSHEEEVETTENHLINEQVDDGFVNPEAHFDFNSFIQENEPEDPDQLTNSQIDEGLTRLQEQRRKSFQLIMESDNRIFSLKLKRVKKNYEACISELNDKISSLETQVEDREVLEQENIGLKEKLDGFEQEVNKLKENLVTSEKESSDLKEKLLHSEQEVNVLKEKSNFMEAQFEEIENENENLIKLMEEKIKELKSDTLKRKRARMSKFEEL